MEPIGCLWHVTLDVLKGNHLEEYIAESVYASSVTPNVTDCVGLPLYARLNRMCVE
jgi:hypothetical protein